MTVLRTPVLASGYSTDSGTGGLTAWAVEASGPGPEAQLRAEQTGSVTLGDASWVVPLGNLLAVIGERDSHLWLVQADNLTVVDGLDLGGGVPCHAALDPTGRLLAVAHYGSGEVSVIGLNPWRAEPQQVGRIRFSGQGPVISRQEGPHAHQVTWLDRGHLAVTDLGTDQIHILKFGPAGLERIGAIPTPPGFGPRHLVLSSHGPRQLITVCGELSGTLLTFTRQAGEEAWAKDWHPHDQVPASRNGRSQPSGLVPGPDGSLLVANRLIGTVSVITGLDTLTSWSGTPSIREEFDCGGANPRDLTVDGDRVWVAQQDAGTVSCYTRGADGWAQRLCLDLPGATHILTGVTV
jgi:6-phosphogluconolactonase